MALSTDICMLYTATESFSEISFYFSIYSHPPKWAKVNMIKIKTLCGYVEHIEKCPLCKNQQPYVKLLFLMHFSVIFLNNQVAFIRNFSVTDVHGPIIVF